MLFTVGYLTTFHVRESKNRACMFDRTLTAKYKTSKNTLTFALGSNTLYTAGAMHSNQNGFIPGFQ